MAVARILVRAAVLYALLVGPWPGLDEAWAGGYRAVMNQLAIALQPDQPVSIVPRRDATRLHDSTVWVDRGLSVGGRPLMGRKFHSSRYYAYVSVALLVALVLATPASGAARVRALGFGLLVVTSLALLRMAAVIALLQPPPPELGQADSWGVLRWSALIAAEKGVYHAWYVGPIFAWGFAFRSEGWRWVRSEAARAANGRGSPPDDAVRQGESWLKRDRPPRMHGSRR